MLDSCYCDYDAPSVFRSKKGVKARKPHRCGECGCDIKPGETYEYVFGVWDGYADSIHTCSRCVAIREHAVISFPCFCWTYRGMIDELRDELFEVSHVLRDEAPGALFAIGRLAVEIRKRRQADGRARYAK